MHHHALTHLSSKTIEQIPHHELLIATHGLAIELMISCALPPNFTSQWEKPFMVKKEEDGKEYRIFKGLVSFYIVKAPQDAMDGILIACETSREIADAVGLSGIAPKVRNYANFQENQEKSRFVIHGSLGLIKLQSVMADYFKKRNPGFKLPFGLDTEIYIRPKKFERFGFRPATA